MGCERGSRVVVVACRRPRPASRCGTCGWGTAGVSPVLFCGPEGPRHASLYATAGPAVQGNSGPEGPSSLTPRPRGPRLHGWHSLPKCPGTFLRAGGLRGAGQQAARARSPCVCSEACLGGAPPERMCESARPEKTRRGGGRSSRGGRWVDPRRSLVSQHCHRGRPRVAPQQAPRPPLPLPPDPPFRTRSQWGCICRYSSAPAARRTIIGRPCQRLRAGSVGGVFEHKGSLFNNHANVPTLWS